MHELFEQVLDNKDLSRAGDLFSLSNQDIEAGLTAVLRKIREISTAPDYVTNTNNQSVVEICITRVTSCIRETGSIEAHVGALVAVLESCLRHNLRPSARGDDPPHAKIASDILSCLFLNYSKKTVMRRALPVAVRYLHVGNNDLRRNVSSYLSLAAIENVEILAQHAQPVIDSIVSGNHLLVRMLPQIYVENPDAVNQHVAGVINQLALCESTEAASILQVAALVAKKNPRLLEKHVVQLLGYLGSSATSGTVLAAFVALAAVSPAPLAAHLPHLRHTAETQPATLGAVVTVCGAVGRLGNAQAAEALPYLVSTLKAADAATMPLVLREVKAVAERDPSLLAEHLPAIMQHAQNAPLSARILIQQLKDLSSSARAAPPPAPALLAMPLSSVPEQREMSCQTEGSVITISSPPLYKPDFSTLTVLSSHLAGTMSLPNYKHASTSTREIGEMCPPSSASHYGSVASTASSAFPPAHPVMHSSSRQVSTRNLDAQAPSPLPVTAGPVGSMHSITLGPSSSVHNMVAGTGNSIHNMAAGAGNSIHNMGAGTGSSIHNMVPGTGSSIHNMAAGTRNSVHNMAPGTGNSIHNMAIGTGSSIHNMAVGTGSSIHSVALGMGSSIHSVAVAARPGGEDRALMVSVSLGASRPLTPLSPLSVLTPVPALNAMPSSYMGQPHAIPFRDAVQQFCEKHLNKIMHYIDNACARVPIPIKATLEESKHKKKYCRMHFVCFGQDEHCLYSQAFFSIRTKVPRIWIHLMFLAIQARSMRAVSQQEPSVGHLKVIWDSLKIDSGNSFVRLVTSSFPSTRDQDLLLAELKNNRYFDVFEFAAALKHWACFLCNHPERIPGLLHDGTPVMEGHLQEKKGRWKIFKRWKTRYFTLSGSTITYSKKDARKETLRVAQIQSVKAVRKGMRDRPKAFEIFANDQTYMFKVKDGNNAEQWVQCLQIAVARLQKHEVSELDIQTWDLKAKMLSKKPVGETQTRL